METKRISQEIVTQIIDEDGLIKQEVKTQSSFIEREPDYVKLYIRDILRLNDIPKSGNEILLSILRRMTYSNDIILIASVKREIAEELGVKEITLRKAIELFVEKSILLRKDRGVYIINPYFFGRGKWEEIKKIRLLIEYSKEGKMMLKTDFELVDSSSY